MIDNILVHIGYHKTGTSWLQEELFDRDSPYFLTVSENGDHLSLANHLVYSEDGYLLSPFCDNYEVIKGEVNSLRQKLNLENGKVPVISSEQLSGNPHSSGFDAKVIAERIKKAFPDARILVVIREQKSITLSCYFQYLASSGVDSLDKYLKTTYDGRRPGFSIELFRYLPLVKEYTRLFGKENVLVLPYEMFKKEPFEFLKRIGDFLNIELDIDPGKFEKKVNLKKYRVIMYRFRWFNYFIKSRSLNAYSSLVNPFTSFVFRGLRKSLSFFTTKGMEQRMVTRLRSKIEDYVQDRFHESNKELAEYIEIDLGEYGYY